MSTATESTRISLSNLPSRTPSSSTSSSTCWEALGPGPGNGVVWAASTAHFSGPKPSLILSNQLASRARKPLAVLHVGEKSEPFGPDRDVRGYQCLGSTRRCSIEDRLARHTYHGSERHAQIGPASYWRRAKRARGSRRH